MALEVYDGGLYGPVDELYAYAECATQTLQSETAIGFEKLAVSKNVHLADIKSSTRRENS